MTIGGAFTAGSIPEGLNTLRAHTIADVPFAPRLYVNGARQRLGADIEWQVGRLFVRGEVMRVTDQRLDMGVDDDDLPPFVARGWYASGGWRVRGSRKDSPGNVELAARVEQLQLGGGPGLAADHPRAATIRARVDEVWTLGTTWQVQRYVRLQGNAIRERAETGAWSGIMRLQFSI
jgi:phosphate-selective porin